MLELLEDGQVQLWAAFEDALCYGAVITEVTGYPGLSALTILFLGGVQFDRWMEQTIEAMVRFAKEEDCSRIEFMGRRGWKRLMEPYGWRETYVFLEKEVGDGQGQDDADREDHADNRASTLGNGSL